MSLGLISNHITETLLKITINVLRQHYGIVNMLRSNTVPQPESFRILSLAFHNWLRPSDPDEALF